MKLFILLGFLFLIVPACNNSGSSKTIISGDTLHQIESGEETLATNMQPGKQVKTIADEFISAGDSVIIPPFEITVELSQTAEKKLRDAKETIIVSAILSGVPKDTTMKEYREWGEFALGNVQVEIPAPGTARFTNAKILKSDFELLGSKDIQILINVFSGRKSDQNNLLSCDILQEPISKVRLQKNVLKGKLIYE